MCLHLPEAAISAIASKGDKVEEVEGPPDPSSQGDNIVNIANFVAPKTRLVTVNIGNIRGPAHQRLTSAAVIASVGERGGQA